LHSTSYLLYTQHLYKNIQKKFNMKKFKSILATAFAGLIMLCVTAVKAQNMNRYITLIVQQGEWINLRFVADVANTTVKIVSGTTDTTFYVNDIKMTNLDYYAQSDTMRVYGDVKNFIVQVIIPK